MRRRPWLLAILIYVMLIVGGGLAGYWLADFAMIDIRPSNEPEIHLMLMTAVAAFVAASAIPFVPGAEIGFALILSLGTRVIPLVYLAMVTALLLAFLIGRFVPPGATAAIFGVLRLRRARDFVLEMAPLDAHGRAELLAARAPTDVLPFLLRHRYLALAVLINLPGNTLIGGGGGIALAAGMSRLYRFVPYAGTIALAVAPLPLVIAVTGHLPGG